MPFQLSRGGGNFPAEVQRWQYFLRKQGIDQVGAIDADFGLNTETATKFFQVKHRLSATGRVNESTLAKAEELTAGLLERDRETVADRRHPRHIAWLRSHERGNPCSNQEAYSSEMTFSSLTQGSTARRMAWGSRIG